MSDDDVLSLRAREFTVGADGDERVLRTVETRSEDLGHAHVEL